MPQPRRSDKPANAVVAFRATAAELAELDRLVAELPGLSERSRGAVLRHLAHEAAHGAVVPLTDEEAAEVDCLAALLPPGQKDRSRGAVLRHLAHEAAHGAVVPLTDEDRMVLGAMLAKRAAELARLGFHDLVPHLTPGRMLQALLRAQAAPVAVVAPVEPVAVVAHEAPLDVEHEAPVAVVAPVEPVAPVVAHEAVVAPAAAPVAILDALVAHPELRALARPPVAALLAAEGRPLPVVRRALGELAEHARDAAAVGEPWSASTLIRKARAYVRRAYADPVTSSTSTPAPEPPPPPPRLDATVAELRAFRAALAAGPSTPPRRRR